MEVPKRAAKRVVIDVKPNSNYAEEAWKNPNGMINIALDALKQNRVVPLQINEDDVSLIINKIGRGFHWIVFDMFHDNFDTKRAHLYGQDLPVTIVTMRRSRKKVAKIFKANDSQERKTNFDIRSLFNRHASCEPPFYEDSREGPAWAIDYKDWRDAEEYHTQQRDEIEAGKGQGGRRKKGAD